MVQHPHPPPDAEFWEGACAEVSVQRVRHGTVFEYLGVPLYVHELRYGAVVMLMQEALSRRTLAQLKRADSVDDPTLPYVFERLYREPSWPPVPPPSPGVWYTAAATSPSYVYDE